MRQLSSFSKLSKLGVISAVIIGSIITITSLGSHQPITSYGAKTNIGSSTAVLGASTVQPATTNPQPTQSITPAKPITTTKLVTETQPLPFHTATVTSSTLAQGITKITILGVNGASTSTYKVSYSDNIQTAKDLISTVITSPPITQITSIGTYVPPLPSPVSTPPQNCTNGSYVNSVGNTVCSPEVAPSAPAGATAQCVDGSYSFSQSHSGTCSHHRGVANWL